MLFSVTLTTTTTDDRTAEVERIVRELVPHASQLTRLVFRHTPGEITRSEGGILRTLNGGPKRVTALAELEGLAQPTVTILIKRLESHGWITRERHPDDGRVVLVSLTPDGEQALEDYRSQYRSVLRDRLALMTDEQVAALGEAIGALDALVVAIQQGEPR
jgi:DNA-binding MarR family transcriptional regulator